MGAGEYEGLTAIPGYDPTMEGGLLFDIGLGFTEHGGELGMMFDQDYIKGLFDPTVQATQYTPSAAFKPYDPEYVLPWGEEDDGGGGGGGGVPTIPGLKF